MKSKGIQRLVLSAVMLGMAAVLSMIKVFELPLGGAVTPLSMLPICILSIRYGVKWGLFSAFVFALIQLGMGLGELMTLGMTVKIWTGCLVFDFLLPFTLLGLSGIFRRSGTAGIIGGITLALILRFLCHFISGSVFFGTWCPDGWNIYLYSFCYNGSYMLPELVFTLIGAVILFKAPQTGKLLTGLQS